MNKLGLNEEELNEIKNTIKKYIEVEEAYIFGSRAKGTYKKGSDIDIAIKGKNITFNTVAKLLSELEEETTLPYFFDIVHYDECTTKALIEHIDRVGICIFKR